MIPEVRKIPAAPRRVRGGPILAHRWPMAALGIFLSGFGGLLSWMLLLASGGKPSQQARLDAGPNEQIPAIVTKVVANTINGPPPGRWQYVHYAFEFGEVRREGSSMAPFGKHHIGERVVIDIAPEAPGIHCILGGKCHFDRVLLRPETWLGIMVMPGLFLMFGYVTGTFRLRQVLVHGDVSTGKLLTTRPIRGVIPDSLLITFEFRDHRAVLRRGRHWVRARSSLGQLARRQVETGWFEPLPVLHDRKMSQWNRMVLAEDFLPTPVTETELEGIG